MFGKNQLVNKVAKIISSSDYFLWRHEKNTKEKNPNEKSRKRKFESRANLTNQQNFI